MEATHSVVLLHGMFGKAGNWQDCAAFLSREWRIFTPELPVFDMPPGTSVVDGLATHVGKLLDAWGVDKAAIGGNSLGGHVALQLALKNPERISGLVLTGSSGLFERGFDHNVPHHPTRDWLRRKMREVFYDETHITEALLDEVGQRVLDRRRALQLLRVAKSAKRDNLRQFLPAITCPVLLAWGDSDHITPPSVAEDFKKLLPNAELCFVARCGHAAMMERPDEFSRIAGDFLRKLWQQA